MTPEEILQRRTEYAQKVEEINVLIQSTSATLTSTEDDMETQGADLLKAKLEFEAQKEIYDKFQEAYVNELDAYNKLDDTRLNLLSQLGILQRQIDALKEEIAAFEKEVEEALKPEPLPEPIPDESNDGGVDSELSHLIIPETPTEEPETKTEGSTEE